MHVIKANDAATELVRFSTPTFKCFLLVFTSIHSAVQQLVTIFFTTSQFNQCFVLVIMLPSNALTPMPQVVQCLHLALSSPINRTHLRRTIDLIARHSSIQLLTLRASLPNSASTLTRRPRFKLTVTMMTTSTHESVLEMGEGIPCQ